MLRRPCRPQLRLQDDGFGLEPLQPGVIMAERYIRLRTMVALCSLPRGAAMPDLLAALARQAPQAGAALAAAANRSYGALPCRCTVPPAAVRSAGAWSWAA